MTSVFKTALAPTAIPNKNPQRIITTVTGIGRPSSENNSGPWNTAKTPAQT